MKKTLLLILLVLVVSFTAYACKPKAEVNNNNATSNKHSAPTNDSNFDPFDSVMSAEIKSAYAFAKDNQKLLKKFYCVCGCMGAMHDPRHKNLAQCFVKSIDSNGKITYDPHGSNCKACLDEALDVKIWTAKGLKFSDITQEYHKKYGNLPGSPSNWDFK